MNAHFVIILQVAAIATIWIMASIANLAQIANFCMIAVAVKIVSFACDWKTRNIASSTKDIAKKNMKLKSKNIFP
jgi:hypothetical protein